MPGREGSGQPGAARTSSYLAAPHFGELVQHPISATGLAIRYANAANSAYRRKELEQPASIAKLAEPKTEDLRVLG